MDNKIAKNTDANIKDKIDEWSNAMFTGKKVKGSGDINTVMLFAPLIQLATTELAGRFVKRMTFLSVFIAVLALFVSLGAYQATKTPHII